jgi:hypothetical protein
MKVMWTRHVARVREKRNSYKIVLGKPERKRLLWRLMHRQEFNIKRK